MTTGKTPHRDQPGVQQHTVGHRGRRDDPLYRIRRLLLTGAERLSVHGQERIKQGLAAGDRDDNYRLRLLLHCGGGAWQDQPAAKLRGRAPQIAA